MNPNATQLPTVKRRHIFLHAQRKATVHATQLGARKGSEGLVIVTEKVQG